MSVNSITNQLNSAGSCNSCNCPDTEARLNALDRTNASEDAKIAQIEGEIGGEKVAIETLKKVIEGEINVINAAIEAEKSLINTAVDGVKSLINAEKYVI